MFPDSHCGTSDHEMLECRRCPQRIVAMANALISNNRDRETRQLEALDGNGAGEVDIVQFDTLAQEATGIAELISHQINYFGRQPADFLVLAQRRSIGNPIHDALVHRSIPSKCYYHEGELDSTEAQERMAVFKLFINPQDRIALRWLLGFGSNDFRAVGYARIRRYCVENRITPWDLLCQLEAGTVRIPHTRYLVERFREISAELGRLRGNGEMANLVHRWLPENIEGIDRFRALVLELVTSAATPADLLSTLIETISTPEIPDVTQVRIMSLHKSKGLSSPVVVIAGCIEGLLPPAPDPEMTTVEQQASLEEQRRLFYVGLTRVKSESATNRPGALFLTYSRRMTLADAMQSGITPARAGYSDAFVQASRFIRELGPASPQPRHG